MTSRPTVLRPLLSAIAVLSVVAASGVSAMAQPTERGDTGAAAPAPPDAASVQLVEATEVCVVYCDGGDPADADSDEIPVDEVSAGGTILSLHTSPTENLGWAAVTSATEGDMVWIERSWDGGATREQPLAPVTAEGEAAQTGTVNLSDPGMHARGIVRACLDPADGSPSVCTEWAYEQVCDGECDGRPAPTDARSEQPVDPATLSHREVTLNLSADGRAWGELERATAGDEVWIERSWDGGTSTRGGGAFLGHTAVAEGSTSAITSAFATSDPAAKIFGGSVRACLRVDSAQSTACTQWARPSLDSAASAAEVLMYSYDVRDAWWPSSWWNSAVATHTMIDYQQQTGDDTFAWMIDRTFEVNRHPFPAGEKSTDEIEGNFISRAIDDAGWWGLAWIDAYDLTGDRKYLDMAEIIGEYMHEYWDEDVCGGGVYWDRERTYKNAVTNGQFVRLAASLHNRLPGDSTWRDRATTGWDWFLDSGMINEDGLIEDGIDAESCDSNGQTVWTYNQGLMIGAGVELWRTTGDATYLDTARELADATVDSDELTPNGILTESCEALDGDACDDNQMQFKGIYMRYIDELDEVTGGEYRDFIDTQSEAVTGPGSDAMGRIGLRWSGESAPGSPNVADWRTQASGMSAILAAS